jgi:hypothetical protein
MIKLPTQRLGRRVLQAVGDRARAGMLPQSLQGGLRAHSAVPMKFDHRGRALGVVVGVDKSEHDLVASAYPEWDFLFVSRRSDPDHIASECQRLQATAIVGPDIRRRFLMAFNTAAINSLSLSPAPLPRLRSAQGVARGFTLEPQSSWVIGRRVSDLDVMFDLRDTILTPAHRADAARLAAALDAKATQQGLLVIDPSSGFWTYSEEARTAIHHSSGAADVIWFDVPKRYWGDEPMDQFDAYLTRCSAVVSMGHPLAVAASMRGFKPQLSKGSFRANYALKAASLNEQATATAEPDSDTIDRIAIGVLIAARYVHDGSLVDPVDFVCGASA